MERDKAGRLARWNRRVTVTVTAVVGIAFLTGMQSYIGVGLGLQSQMITLSPVFLTPPDGVLGDGPRVTAMAMDVDVHGHPIHTVFGGAGCATVVKALNDQVCDRRDECTCFECDGTRESVALLP